MSEMDDVEKAVAVSDADVQPAAIAGAQPAAEVKQPQENANYQPAGNVNEQVPAGKRRMGLAMGYAAGVVLVIIAIAAVFFFYTPSISSTTTVTLISNSTSTGASAPVISNFNLVYTSNLLTKGIPAGAIRSHLFRYNASSGGDSMTVRTLTYPNMSGMLQFYNSAESSFSSSNAITFFSFSGEVPNTTGGETVITSNGMVQRTAFSLDSYKGDVLIAITLIVPQPNPTPSQGYVISVLLGALNSTISKLGSLS